MIELIATAVAALAAGAGAKPAYEKYQLWRYPEQAEAVKAGEKKHKRLCRVVEHKYADGTTFVVHSLCGERNDLSPVPEGAVVTLESGHWI